jgi:hypothetical protein
VEEHGRTNKEYAGGNDLRDQRNALSFESGGKRSKEASQTLCLETGPVKSIMVGNI